MSTSGRLEGGHAAVSISQCLTHRQRLLTSERDRFSSWGGKGGRPGGGLDTALNWEGGEYMVIGVYAPRPSLCPPSPFSKIRIISKLLLALKKILQAASSVVDLRVKESGQSYRVLASPFPMRLHPSKEERRGEEGYQRGPFATTCLWLVPPTITASSSIKLWMPGGKPRQM